MPSARYGGADPSGDAASSLASDALAASARKPRTQKPKIGRYGSFTGPRGGSSVSSGIAPRPAGGPEEALRHSRPSARTRRRQERASSLVPAKREVAPQIQIEDAAHREPAARERVGRHDFGDDRDPDTRDDRLRDRLARGQARSPPATPSRSGLALDRRPRGSRSPARAQRASRRQLDRPRRAPARGAMARRHR